jgi:hypothetical protein
MDDYYELFHGLNPILAIRIRRVGRPHLRGVYRQRRSYDLVFFQRLELGLELVMDFVSYPWLTGLPEADPDADGLIILRREAAANTRRRRTTTPILPRCG